MILNNYSSGTSVNHAVLGEERTSTLPENLIMQIEEIVDTATEKKDYLQFCESQVSKSTIQNPNQISEVEENIRKIISYDIESIPEDSGEFEYLIYKTILYYDSLSIMVFESLINSGKIDYILAVEILGFLGRINHPSTYHHRTLLLQNCLFNKSRYVRDGARLGLLYLNNPVVCASLEKAIESEDSERLKEKLIIVLTTLRN